MLAKRDFRRLFAVRLVSQTGDGIITAGVGTYVFFNASTFPDPAAARRRSRPFTCRTR